MKTKFTYLWMVVMTMVLALGFTACSDDDDPIGAEASIIGEWEQINDSGTYFLINFRSDKTGRIEYTYSDGSGGGNENFEYDYIETERSLTIIGSQLDGDYSVTLTSTTLRLNELNYQGNATGTYYDFTRP